MPQIWSEDYIWQLHNDADEEICRQLDVVFTRIALPIKAGQAVYTLPDYVRKVDSLWWRGKKIDPISYESMMLLHNGTRSNQAYYYCFWPSGPKDIRLHPTPAEDIYPSNPIVWGNLNKWQEYVGVQLDSGPVSTYETATLNVLNEQLSPLDYNYAGNFVVADVYRLPEPSSGNADFQLPEWMARRTKKAFVLSKAYAKEGAGQNLAAALYFAQKFDFLIARFKEIFGGCFVSKKYRLAGGYGQMNNRIGRTPARPSLPSNFERNQY